VTAGSGTQRRWRTALLFWVTSIVSSCGASGAVSPSGTAIGVICVPSDCLSGAVYEGPLFVGSSDPLHLIITACRNEVCAKTTLTFDAAERHYVGHIVGPLTVAIALTTDSTPAHLLVHIVGRPELLSDGDRYELSVALPSGQLLSRQIPSATYGHTRHSDPNCTADCVSITL